MQVATDQGPKRQVGKKIAYWRVERNLTQEELGAKLGLTQSTLSKIESEDANARLATLHLAASVLGIPVSEILREPAGREAA